MKTINLAYSKGISVAEDREARFISVWQKGHGRLPSGSLAYMHPLELLYLDIKVSNCFSKKHRSFPPEISVAQQLSLDLLLN